MLTLQYDFNFFWILAYKNSVLFLTCFVLFCFRSFSKATCDMNFIRIVFKCKRWYVYLTHCSFFLEVNKSLTKTIWIVKKNLFIWVLFLIESGVKKIHNRLILSSCITNHYSVYTLDTSIYEIISIRIDCRSITSIGRY